MSDIYSFLLMVLKKKMFYILINLELSYECFNFYFFFFFLPLDMCS